MIVEEEFLTSEQKSPEQKDAQADDGLHAWLFFAALFGLLVVLLQSLWQPRAPIISNFYIPDSVNLYRGVLTTANLDLSNLLSLPSIGLLLFYGPFKAIDPRLLFIPNLAMWLACMWAAYRIFSPIDKRAAQFAIIAIVFNPYLLLGLSGPTKELPLMFLVLLFLLLPPTWNRLPYFALIIAVTYSVRDGYALIMLGWLSVHLLLPRTLWRVSWVLLCLVPLFMLLGLRSYASPLWFTDELEREGQLVGQISSTDVGAGNVERALAGLDDPWPTTREYFYRALANGYSTLIRPAFYTISDRISLIGAGYFLNAFFLAAGLIAIILTCISPGEDERILYLAWFVMLTWAMVSLVLFVQPRYLMPVTPVAMGVLGTRKTSTRILIIFAVISISVIGFLFLTYVLNVDPIISMDSPLRPPFFLFGE